MTPFFKMCRTFGATIYFVFWTKYRQTNEILLKNRTLGQKSNFWSKIELWVKHRTFGQKSTLAQTSNFCQKSNFLSKYRTFRQTTELLVKIELLMY